jgi:hypothetical protein
MSKFFEESNLHLSPIKKGYKISYFGSNLRIKAPKCFIPFGIEEYCKKLILNIEFNPEESNEIHNFVSSYLGIEKVFQSPDDHPNARITEEFKCETDNLTYMSNIKQRLNKVLLRTHVKNPEIYKKENDKKVYVSLGDLKLKSAIVELEINQIWTTKDSFGLLLYITEIEIVN